MPIKFPKGPVAPILSALDENEIFHGWVESIEASSARLFADLQSNPGVEIDGEWHPTYQGLDGQTWALDHLFGQHFPSLQRSSAFLTIWGSFERHLTAVCREIARAGHYRVTINDLEGKGVTRVHAYLTKVVNLAGDWDTTGWQEFPHFNRLRNVFAHGDGHIDSSQDKLSKYIAISPHIALDEDLIRLGPTFLPYYLSKERRLLHGLERALLERFSDGA